MDPLIAALLDPRAYDHPVGRIELLETHISWILLTGSVAYKVKKPVNLGFVDFSTAERRRWFCQEEVRLNRRLAPELYLGVRTIHGPRERASFRGPGEPIETAVQMVQFPQEDLLPAVLERGGVDPDAFAALAVRLADFHGAAAVAAPRDPYGEPEAVRAPALANLEVLERCGPREPLLEDLRRWTREEGERLDPLFRRRKAEGRIREGHGDLHLGNMALRAGRIEVFDCLEFSPELRWIDAISDLAFLAMDLGHRGRSDLGALVLNRWLERGGDYSGLQAWRWYVTYRALVRAKVQALRLGQGGLDPQEIPGLRRERSAFLEAAHRTTSAGRPSLVLTHGVSGSGKTHLARALCDRRGWIHLRSDIERLRLFGRWGSPPATPLQGDAYAPEVSAFLYGSHLAGCAAAALDGGFTVVVDAAFLLRRQRDGLRAVARQKGVPLRILDCRCSSAVARQRIVSRLAGGGDPSEATPAVLSRQMEGQEPLEGEELACALTVDTSGPVDAGAVAHWVERQSPRT